MLVEQFIKDHIDQTVRQGKNNDPDRISLPFPYTVPSISEAFQEMYYWDTYFTNKGLLLLGKTELAINNVENLAWLARQYGFIPNGTHVQLLNRSQPPVFVLAVADVWQFLSEEKKSEFVEALKKEYSFWDKRRKTELGLNRYDCETTEEEYLAFAHMYERRVGIVTEHSAIRGRDIMAEAESGWDFSPRFPLGCTNYCPVDLNSLLYALELFLAEKDNIEESRCGWREKAEKRKEQMRLLLDENGVYSDYGLVDGKPSGIYSCAGFFPYFLGLSQDKAGYEKLLSVLERDFGVISCVSEEKRFQWAAPNGWAPLFYVCVMAGERLGLRNSAVRVAKKFVDMLDRGFAKTGKLYEKYDVETGEIGLGGEYGTPEMLGWTAGVYLALKEYINDQANL